LFDPARRNTSLIEQYGNMSTEQWEELKQIFNETLEQPREARDAFLKQACATRPELLPELQRLLTEYELESGTLSHPALGDAELGEREDAPRFAPGTILAGRFRIVEFIARGGMGEIYEAEDLELGEHVALKTIRRKVVEDERVLALFKTEIQLARRVTHPNVCRIYDLEQHGELGPGGELPTSFLSMELLHGQTLAQHLRTHGPFTPEAALPLIRQIAAALQAAHDAGVIHRDFKPGNVMLVPEPEPNRFRAVVTDFGLALPAMRAGASDPGTDRGTPGYMAPEQREGRPITPATDVYALALVIASMLGARRQVSEVSRLRALLNPAGSRPDKTQLNLPSSARRWRGVLMRCLERDAGRRYSRPADVAGVLSRTARTRFRPLPAVAALLALGIGLAALSLRSTGVARRFGSHIFGSHLAFQEHDWVLLDGFENRTGEALFDGTLQAALEAELTNSGFVSVVPRERVEDTLRLMRRPVDTRLNRALAQEVCQRDGEIRALVTGRTEKFGNTYVLRAELIDPTRNRVIAADTESAGGQDQIWPAVRKLSNWVRESLGEAMQHIELSNQRLEKATTRSLRALQLFSAADAASRHREWAISAQLTRQALAEDPDFASAHVYLAFALKNLSQPGWQDEAGRALALASTVGERERYFILGSYEVLMDHPDRAIPPFQALIRLYPDHYFAYANLANVYFRLGRLQEASEMEVHRADMRPSDYFSNSRAAQFFIRLDVARASHYAQRALSLAPRHFASLVDLGNFIDVRYFHFHELWMRDDVDGALAELQRLAKQGPAGPYVDDAEGRIRLEWTMALCNVVLGRLQTARKLIDTIEELPDFDFRSWFFFDIGDEASARARTGLHQDPVKAGVLFLFPRYWPERTQKATWFLKQPLPPGVRRVVLGEMDLAQGRLPEALNLLQQSFDEDRKSGAPMAQVTGQDLATALEKSGDEVDAVKVLEAVSGMRIRNSPAFGFYGVFWLRNQARLSAYYHRLGRDQEARKIDDQLRKLLAFADPDHPILQRLGKSNPPFGEFK
jgi:tetratricopeptide (TPR) repeat protein